MELQHWNVLNNVLKLPGVDYVVKNWALALMLKALALVHFWSVLLLKEQMMTSVRKTLKRLVWSAQIRLISSEICLENNHKIGRFLLIAFWWSIPWKLLRNSRKTGQFFREFVPKNPMKLDFFFRDLSEALTSTDTCTKKHFPKKYQGWEIPLGRRQTSWLLIYKCDQGVELRTTKNKPC